MNAQWIHTNVHPTLEDGMPAQGSHAYWVLLIDGREIGRAWPRIGRWHATTHTNPHHIEFGSRDEAFRTVIAASPLPHTTQTESATTS